MNSIKAKAGIRVEQDLDLVLRNMKHKLLGKPHDEVLNKQTHNTNTTKQMKTAFLKMAYFSGNIVQKRVTSNSTKFASRSN